MQLSQRDRSVITHVDRFNQLSSAQIQALVFHGLSPKPCERSLTRLVRRGYLARIERRHVGGARGGSGQYVYELGADGLRAVGSQKRYYPHRVNYHSLAIADVFVALRQAERDDWLEVEYFETEPDTWVMVDGDLLKPDMYVIVKMARGRLPIWLEIDLGTERARHIKEKLNRYAHAEERLNGDVWPVMPLVLFLTPDDARTREIRHIVGLTPEGKRGLFKVTETERFPEVFRT